MKIEIEQLSSGFLVTYPGGDSFPETTNAIETKEKLIKEIAIFLDVEIVKWKENPAPF